MISQKLIAEKAGVSFATVSRALTHSAKVRPETLKRIRDAMLELGITNTDDLFLGKSVLSKLVLVVVGDICTEFFASIIVGLSDVLTANGYSIALCNSHYDAGYEISSIQSAQDNGYAGIVMITAVETNELVIFLQHAHIPIVLVNRYIRSLDMDVVRIDNYRGGYLAAQYLIENGHRRIAHLAGPKNSSAVEDRLRGFRHAMLDSGLSFSDSDLVFGDLSRECGKQFARHLADGDYTAAYIGNDCMTAGTMHQLIKLGLSVPDDVSLISFDDSPLINEDGLNVTCIGYDSRTMGNYAAETLLKRIEDPLGRRIKTICSPTLTKRASVRCFVNVK